MVKQKGANSYSQMLFPEDKNLIYVRNFSTTWGDWQKITTETDLNKYQKIKSYSTTENFANLYKAIISDWSNIEIGTTIANVSSSSGA